MCLFKKTSLIFSWSTETEETLLACFASTTNAWFALMSFCSNWAKERKSNESNLRQYRTGSQRGTRTILIIFNLLIHCTMGTKAINHRFRYPAVIIALALLMRFKNFITTLCKQSQTVMDCNQFYISLHFLFRSATYGRLTRLSKYNKLHCKIAVD